MLVVPSVLLALLCIWIVIPPLNPPTIVASVASIELSPYLLLINAALLFLAVRSRARFRSLAVGAAALSVVCCALPVGAALLQGLPVGFPVLSSPTVPVVELDIPVQLGDVRTAIHAYLPPDGTRNPIVFAIYGGAWQTGTPQNDAILNRNLARRGYAVFALDYRHAPKYQFPVALQDVHQQVDLITRTAATYRADSRRLAIMGHSSGGELAELSVFAPHSKFRALISYSGAVDLAKGYEVVPIPDPISVRSIIFKYMGDTPANMPARYRAATPLMQVRAGLPPTLLIYGTRDHVVDIRYAWKFRDEIRNRGNDVTFLELPWTEHAFEDAPYGLHSPMAFAAVTAFLQRTL
ncbi:MAG: alpha/beta hydrolase [Candidatus Eremiobacteraeota bacterium]|nr:alpha/beta hydrolase [Candidatus Eremiobacteraeota bacterium]